MEEKHTCMRVVGWEIVKENGIWHLRWYYPRATDDPEYRPLPSVMEKDVDWKELGYFNPAMWTSLVIRYCPFCGAELPNDDPGS